ncbi:Transcriptional regulator, MarR family [Methanosarcina barkeri 3]|uniref:Transcriptional regulator, MarR family n=1 Tax=Methanosarcina barkeri 3 TaxID=1434107 RepID=A0A0E3SEV0_METBA|nr:MarR family transcriptional regulator [Methanosarcina barkeri]AKB80744.1 Transcriptional regulator, MarR family [Methanosarcina barkeri 3]
MNEEETPIQWIEDIDKIAALISFTYRSVQKHFAKELAPYHIGWGHFSILMSLYCQEGRSQDSLAQSRGFDKTMIAKSILKLEKEGIVYRITDPEDKRIKRLYLTEKGRKLKPEMRKIGFEMNSLLLKGFDSDELPSAIEIVRKIALNAAQL